jgi:ABC-type glycerol-3-phosphate transport system substrate-binding protein
LVRLGALVALLAIGITSGIPLAQAAHSHAQTTLTMWAWADRQYCPVEFVKLHPDVKVNYAVNFSPTQRMTVLKRAGANSGFPDVYFDSSESVLNDARLGFAVSLDDVVPPSMKAKYAPHTLDQLYYQGHLVSVPNDMAAFGIWYNVHNMKAAGLSIPTSYDQMWQQALQLAKTKKYYISMEGADGWMLTELAWGNEAGWFKPNADGSWHVNIDTPLMEQVTQKYVNAVRSGGILPDDPTNPVSGKAIAAGKVVYSFSANWLGHYVIEATYPSQKGQWSFAASIPSVGWWGGASYMVPPESQHQALAKQLAVFCSTAPQFQRLTGTLTSYTGVWDQAGFARPDPFWANPQEVVAQIKLSGTRTGKNWYFAPDENFVDQDAGTHLLRMIQGVGTVHNELQALQKEVIDNLQQIGVDVS